MLNNFCSNQRRNSNSSSEIQEETHTCLNEINFQSRQQKISLETWESNPENDLF
jgi:hypothetical protein